MFRMGIFFLLGARREKEQATEQITVRGAGNNLGEKGHKQKLESCLKSEGKLEEEQKEERARGEAPGEREPGIIPKLRLCWDARSGQQRAPKFETQNVREAEPGGDRE